VTPRLTVVDADGRQKAFRPLPADVRAAALAAGIAAYERGDFFEAHELLEPAWMGTADRAERSFLQGLIKLAAAYVHATRGNPPGIIKNLAGAKARLVDAATERPSAAGDVDLTALLADIEVRLVDLAMHPTGPSLTPPVLRRRAS
jgi:predicted metal-dependent hydrolase